MKMRGFSNNLPLLLFMIQSVYSISNHWYTIMDHDFAWGAVAAKSLESVFKKCKKYQSFLKKYLVLFCSVDIFVHTWKKSRDINSGGAALANSRKNNTGYFTKHLFRTHLLRKIDLFFFLMKIVHLLKTEWKLRISD